MSKDYKHELNLFGEITEKDFIVCPYCENKHELNGEYFEDEGRHEYEDSDFECHSCGKYFEVHAEVRFQFWATTKLIEGEE